MRPVVNKWLDLLDRVGWTGMQALGSAGLVALTTDNIGWEAGIKFVAFAVALAICKVLIGQNTGTDDTGALIGQPVIEPAPKEAT